MTPGCGLGSVRIPAWACVFPAWRSIANSHYLLKPELTPMQALTLATSNAAALLKLEDRGVLAVGKLANLAVLDGDPTADIGNSKRIHAVWHRGKQAAGPVEMFTP